MNSKENYPKLQEFQIEQWEMKNNIKIPSSYRKYLLENNAGYFISEPNVFDVPKMGGFALANFLGLSDDIYGLEHALKVYKDRFPDKYFPIAYDVVGNLTPEEESYGELIDIFDGDDEGIRKLLDSGWDIDTPCEFNQTLIQRAALANRVWLVEELIKRGAKLDGAIQQSMTLNSFESLELLLAGGANLEKLDKQGYTPLQKAVMGNKPKAVQLLLKYGANKDVIDEFGDTPLETALFKKGKGVDMDEIIAMLQNP
ncbi:ankyrin repeat domain-containing protein [Chryseobacterium gambrini]|uniref:Ankyrin repeat domain-containing protein n=1 Tax=Chryseobacterium gambrini TaxID=373672 RepID=A0AAJ1R6V3_9FLAO|nr:MULTISPECIES: ankyrin repeat domain-containing protein [Chryseobacterium]MDN4015075.1 ankyrin repeat domain-containing protein [Chryseobacterium gambrini]MDN4028078.1 ankyrin repeat domain-containing protein [Chryseobacterium gambrini]QWA39794.1 ankyrin repeat domain-containing protein [Chryseobacterium sp. ZHDP1]